MASRILTRLHEDDEVRRTFQQLVRYLLQVSVPPDKAEEYLVGARIRTTPYSTEELEETSLEFDSQLTALTNLTRAIDVQENETNDLAGGLVRSVPGPREGLVAVVDNSTHAAKVETPNSRPAALYPTKFIITVTTSPIAVIATQ